MHIYIYIPYICTYVCTCTCQYEKLIKLYVKRSNQRIFEMYARVLSDFISFHMKTILIMSPRLSYYALEWWTCTKKISLSYSTN